MKKIMLAFGTRPEAIKMAPLCHALKNIRQFEIVIYATAQHRSMLDQALDDFDLKPDVDLNLMQKNQSVTSLIANILKESEQVFAKHKPDMVLVHGDTATSMAVSMAAFLNNTVVGHVEAGLRTHNLKNPFPEEFNRQIIGVSANHHFASTATARNNLLAEKKPEQNIIVTGNTIIDSLFWMANKLNKNQNFAKTNQQTMQKYFDFDIFTQKFVLITVHRRENFGENLLKICSTLKRIANDQPDIKFLLPVHPNPNIKNPIESQLQNTGNIYLLPPLAYPQFTLLLQNCYLIITDSGGIQEEAPSFGKPMIILRNTTERQEVIDEGLAKLVGADEDAIFLETKKLIENKEYYKDKSKTINLYGDGTASKKIADYLTKVL